MTADEATPGGQAQLVQPYHLRIHALDAQR
jgi:hypothetical protein